MGKLMKQDHPSLNGKRIIAKRFCDINSSFSRRLVGEEEWGADYSKFFFICIRS